MWRHRRPNLFHTHAEWWRQRRHNSISRRVVMFHGPCDGKGRTFASWPSARLLAGSARGLKRAIERTNERPLVVIGGDQSCRWRAIKWHHWLDRRARRDSKQATCSLGHLVPRLSRHLCRRRLLPIATITQCKLQPGCTVGIRLCWRLCKASVARKRRHCSAQRWPTVLGCIAFDSSQRGSSPVGLPACVRESEFVCVRGGRRSPSAAAAAPRVAVSYRFIMHVWAQFERRRAFGRHSSPSHLSPSLAASSSAALYLVAIAKAT